MLTGDLDEYSIAALAAAPVDGYGVGTSLVTGSGAPTAALVYKLVARGREDGDGELLPVAKRSVGKPSKGGRKWAVRELGPDGRAVAERVIDAPPEPRRGPCAAAATWSATARSSAASRSSAARARHQAAVAELPAHARPAVPRLPGDPDHLPPRPRLAAAATRRLAVTPPRLAVTAPAR